MDSLKRKVLDARYSKEPEFYPLYEVLKELEDFDPSIKPEAREGLEKVYQMRRDGTTGKKQEIDMCPFSEDEPMRKQDR